MLIRIPLLIAGAIAAIFVARESPNFEVVQGMIAIAVIAAVVVVAALWRRKR